MTAWYEFEEHAGRIWHGWAVRERSYPDHPDAAVTLDELRDALAVYFRALGGDHAVGVAAAAEVDSDHRLTLRQRLGLQREPVPQAARRADAIVLPDRLALFPRRSLNRDLYYWLAAWLARAARAPERADPLQRDLLAVVRAEAVSAEVAASLPGLRRRHDRLNSALLQARPRRRLPPDEDAVEALIRAALGDDAPLPARALALRAWALDDRGDAPQAPRGYRPPLPVPTWGVWLADRTGAAPAGDDEPEPGEAAEDPDGRRRTARRRSLDQADRDDPLLLNPFEKMLSWSEMVNVNRAVEDDEEDSARRAADQLEELALAKHRKNAATRLKMELDVDPAAVEEAALADDGCVPEWNYRKRALMPEYCAIVTGPADERPASESEAWRPDAATRARIRRVRRQFEALRPRRERLRRQFDGEDLDFDALVRYVADRAAGEHPSGAVWSCVRERARDLAVATLIDVSLSTDAWLEDRRVLDVEKEALLVLAHGIQACGDEHAIHAFSSRRRRRVEVRTVKDFDERVDERVERRIGALRPGEYTRMGAAIRHVARRLEQRPNRHRLLLVLTDGKPNDTDHYEGRYAIEDTRMAVREARRAGLTVFGVTIDAEARAYFPAIFGRAGHAIVDRPEGLARALPMLYRQLIR